MVLSIECSFVESYSRVKPLEAGQSEVLGFHVDNVLSKEPIFRSSHWSPYIYQGAGRRFCEMVQCSSLQKGCGIAASS